MVKIIAMIKVDKDFMLVFVDWMDVFHLLDLCFVMMTYGHISIINSYIYMCVECVFGLNECVMFF